jgi:hypothetical protein
VSVKQDRQGARTPADVERKYNFGKKFAEVYGMITDARDSVDSLGSELRKEITEESTAIRRDTQQIVLEATKDVVRAEEFGEYKKSAEASLTVTAEGIRQEVSAVEKSVTQVSSDLVETNKNLASTNQNLADTNESLANTDKNLAEYWEYTQEVESGVDTKLETKAGEILGQVSKDYYNKTQVDKSLGDINTGISELDDKIDENYTKVTDEYKAHTAGEIKVLDDKISLRVKGTEDRLTDVETGVGGVETALNDYTAATDAFKDKVNQDLIDANDRIDDVVKVQSDYEASAEAQFDVLDNSIGASVSEYQAGFTRVNASLDSALDDIDQNYSAFESFESKTKSDMVQLSNQISMDFTHHEENYTNINGKVSAVETNLEKHFDFGLNGLTIRAGANEMKLRIDNDVISFYKGAIDENDLTKNRFGWWDGVNFHTGNIVIEVQERAQFGNFAFVPRSDGSLDFLKVGG